MRKIKFILILVFIFSLITIAYANVKLKIVAVNPSKTDVKVLPVKAYLPKGTTPEDLVEKGKFEVGYDFDKSLYYVYQDVTLEPGESTALEISMRQTWNIPVEELDILKQHTTKLLEKLQNTEYQAQTKILGDNIINRLNTITSHQDLSSISVEQSLENFDTDTIILREVKKDIGVLEDLAIELGLVIDDNILGENALEDKSLHLENIGLDLEKLGTIKLKIEISNPLDGKSILPLKYYLPIEVKPEYVVDSGGLDVAYDYQRVSHYVYKDALEFGPKEKKEFTVEVKDIWIIPEGRITALKDHTQKVVGLLSGSDYQEMAKSLGNQVITILDGILSNQRNQSLSVQGHIGDYRINLVKFDDARKDVAKLEKLLFQAEGSSTALKSVEKTKGRVSTGNSTERKAVRGIKGLEVVAKSIFRGKAPNTSTTWKIIFAIIAFLALVSFLFFILWWMQVKLSAGKKKDNIEITKISSESKK